MRELANIQLAGSREVACYLNNRSLFRLPAIYERHTGHLRDDKGVK